MATAAPKATTTNQAAGESGAEQHGAVGVGAPFNRENRTTAQPGLGQPVIKEGEEAREQLLEEWRQRTAAVGDRVPPEGEEGATGLLEATAQFGHAGRADASGAIETGAAPELTLAELQEVLAKADNVATDGLPHILSQIEPGVIQRIKNGQAKDVLKGKLETIKDKVLHPSTAEEKKRYPADPPMEKIIKGAHEYMGGVDYVKRVHEINDALKAAHALAEAKGQHREAWAWTSAFSPNGVEMFLRVGERDFQDKNELARAVQAQTAVVESLAGQKDKTDELQAAKAELMQLRDNLKIITRIEEIRETDEFRNLYDNQDIEGIKKKLEPYEAVLTKLTDEKMNELTQDYNQKNRVIVEQAQNRGPNAAEFVKLMDDLPEALIANPGMYEHTEALMNMLKSDKLKKLGQEFMAMLLLYIFGITFN